MKNIAAIMAMREEAVMAMVEVGLNMKASLYKNLTKLVKDNGRSTTHALEQAAEHYIQFVAPTQGTVHPEIMAHARKSIEKNRMPLLLLAK